MLKGKRNAQFYANHLVTKSHMWPEQYLMTKTRWIDFSLNMAPPSPQGLFPLSLTTDAHLPSSALTWTVRTPPLPIPPWPSQSPASILIFPILLLPEDAPVLALRAYKFVFPPRGHCPTFLKVWSHCKENTGQWTCVLSLETQKYKKGWNLALLEAKNAPEVIIGT